MTTRSVHQDLAYDTNANSGETVAGVIASLENTYGVTVEIVKDEGPAGWPLVVISDDDREQVKRVLCNAWGYDPEDVSLELDEDQEQ